MTRAATLALVSAMAVASAAHAELIGMYYMLPNAMAGHSRHIDVQQGIDGVRVPGLVQPTLGPTGLPMITRLAATRDTGSGPIHDVNENGEIMWWKPGRTGDKEVMAEKMQSDSSTLNISANFYPDGESGDSRCFRAVHWKGSYLLGPGQSGSLAMSLLADDDAWVFVNGQLALDCGGVKALTASAPVFNTAPLGEGMNSIDIFYADRNTVQAGILFQSSLLVVPTPGCLVGLAGACGLAARRRRR